jgi:hypothetical protein
MFDAQEFPGHRHPLRQARQDLPRRRSACLCRHPPQLKTGSSLATVRTLASTRPSSSGARELHGSVSKGSSSHHRDSSSALTNHPQECAHAGHTIETRRPIARPGDTSPRRRRALTPTRRRLCGNRLTANGAIPPLSVWRLQPSHSLRSGTDPSGGDESTKTQSVFGLDTPMTGPYAGRRGGRSSRGPSATGWVRGRGICSFAVR